MKPSDPDGFFIFFDDIIIPVTALTLPADKISCSCQSQYSDDREARISQKEKIWPV